MVTSDGEARKRMAILVTMVLLKAICSWVAFARTGCKLPHLELQSYAVEGDVMFGGLIPVYLETLPAAFSFIEPPAPRNCNRLYTEMYQCVLAMVFATEEINRNPLLLPNLTLGFHVVDSCYTESAALKGTLWLLSGQRNTQPNYRCQGTHKMPIILGDLFSISSVEVAQLLGRLNIPQLLQFVKNVHFRNTVGEFVFFDANGDTAHPNDMVHWQMEMDGSSRYVTFGTYDSRLSEDQRLTINDDKVWWGRSYSQVPISVCSKGCPLGYREVAQEGKPVCCFDCLQCPQGEIANTTGLRSCFKCPEDHWSNRERVKCIKKNVEFLRFDETLGIVLAAIAVVLALITILVLLIFIRYREAPIVRANNRALSYILLISLVLCFLCPLTFIGRPEKSTCVLRQVVFGVIFSLCVSCILAKTTVVVLAFKAREPNSKYRSWLAVRIPSLIILVCLLTQVTLCVIWLLSSPPYLEVNMKDSVEKIIFQCNENSETAFYCMLGFLSLLACLSFLVAFQARKLPDRFNETKWITFSMMAFLSVWALFIPAYLSTKGKYMVAVEVFAILSSSAAVLVCIFFPKCYIVLLKSDMHTREKLTRINEKCNLK